MINRVFALAAHISVADGDSAARQKPSALHFSAVLSNINIFGELCILAHAEVVRPHYFKTTKAREQIPVY